MAIVKPKAALCHGNVKVVADSGWKRRCEALHEARRSRPRRTMPRGTGGGDASRPAGGMVRARANARGGDSYAWSPTALGAEERFRHVVRVAVEVVHRPLEIGDLQPGEEANRGVPQGRHDSRAMARAHWRPVLVVHPVTFPVQPHCDAPVPADPRPDLGRAGLFGREIGEAEHHLRAGVGTV